MDSYPPSHRVSIPVTPLGWMSDETVFGGSIFSKGLLAGMYLPLYAVFEPDEEVVDIAGLHGLMRCDYL